MKYKNLEDAVELIKQARTEEELGNLTQEQVTTLVDTAIDIVSRRAEAPVEEQVAETTTEETKTEEVKEESNEG